MRAWLKTLSWLWWTRMRPTTRRTKSAPYSRRLLKNSNRGKSGIGYGSAGLDETARVFYYGAGASRKRFVTRRDESNAGCGFRVAGCGLELVVLSVARVHFNT